MICEFVIFSSFLLYDVVPEIYTRDYDGYGYSDPSHTPQALAQELIEDTLFQNSQMGMKIEQVEDSKNAIEVKTTGSKFVFNKRKGSVYCYQSIGKSRELIRVNFEGIEFQEVHLRGSNQGYVLFNMDEFTFRVNGDGLLMVQIPIDLRIEIDIQHQFDYLGRDTPCRTKKNFSHLFLDEYGGFGVYLVEDEEYELTLHKFKYRLNAGQVFWIAIFPPREYSYEKAKNRLIFYKGHPDFSFYPVYPTSKEFGRWSGINVDSTSFRSEIDGRWGTNPDHIDYGEIVALISDVELWTSWHNEYIPRCGWEKFHETIELAHARNKKIVFYVSPSQFYKYSRYFVLGSEYYLGDSTRPILIRNIAQIYKEHKYWPPGNPEGENMEEFLKAVKLMIDHRRYDADEVADGIYVDGLYFLNIPRSYVLLRKLRQLLGEDRIICVHSAPIPGGDAYLPTLEAYADYVVKGEGGRMHYNDSKYMKYFIRTYGISNAIGIFLNERDKHGNYLLPSKGRLMKDLIDYRLQVRFDSPLIDLASRWDAAHNWEDYRQDIICLWKILSQRSSMD